MRSKNIFSYSLKSIVSSLLVSVSFVLGFPLHLMAKGLFNFVDGLHALATVVNYAIGGNPYLDVLQKRRRQISVVLSGEKVLLKRKIYAHFEAFFSDLRFFLPVMVLLGAPFYKMGVSLLACGCLGIVLASYRVDSQINQIIRSKMRSRGESRPVRFSYADWAVKVCDFFNRFSFDYCDLSSSFRMSKESSRRFRAVAEGMFILPLKFMPVAGLMLLRLPWTGLPLVYMLSRTGVLMKLHMRVFYIMVLAPTLSSITSKLSLAMLSVLSGKSYKRFMPPEVRNPVVFNDVVRLLQKESAKRGVSVRGPVCAVYDRLLYKYENDDTLDPSARRRKISDIDAAYAQLAGRESQELLCMPRVVRAKMA